MIFIKFFQSNEKIGKNRVIITDFKREYRFIVYCNDENLSNELIQLASKILGFSIILRFVNCTDR